MDNLEPLLKIFSGVSGITGIIIIIILYKIGLLDFLIKIKKNGNGRTDQRIIDLEKHADIANGEMGKIYSRLGKIENDISEIKGSLKILIKENKYE